MKKALQRGASRRKKTMPLNKSFPKKPFMFASAAIITVFSAISLLPSEQVETRRSKIKPSLDEYQAADKSNKLKAVDIVKSNHSIHPSVKTAIEDIKNEHGHWYNTTVKFGDNLSTLFKQQGLNASVVHSIVSTPKLGRFLTNIRPGEHLEFRINKAGTLTQLRYIQSELKSIFFSKTKQGYKGELISLQPNTRITYAEAKIENSLFVASQKAGLSDNLTMELASIFAWDIDFALDIRLNDSFTVIYEEKYLENKKLEDGNILAAIFINQGKQYTAIRYTDSNGNSSYYTPDGHSMKKAFLRTPVDFTRISSRFNPNRLHPVFKTKRPHKGVDYAAPMNTPIKAAGNGRVKFAGWKNGYGNVVLLQHPNNIVTVYAHQNKIRKGLKVGQTVKQGNIIGYVGRTGWATGPHLHYEFRINGVHRNPITVKLPDAAPVPKKEKAHFAQISERILAQLEAASGTILAQQ